MDQLRSWQKDNIIHSVRDVQAELWYACVALHTRKLKDDGISIAAIMIQVRHNSFGLTDGDRGYPPKEVIKAEALRNHAEELLRYLFGNSIHNLVEFHSDSDTLRRSCLQKVK